MKSAIKIFALLVLCLFVIQCSTADKQAQNDPYLWLEEIESENSLKWVDAQNEVSKKVLEGDPIYKKYLKTAESLVMDKDRIPTGQMRGNYYYNFWQDEKHIKGIWRRTLVSEFQKDKITWEVILDFDKLGKSENENWVFKGADCSNDDFSKCMLSLSRGGKDAVVIREFDINEKTFVKNGFYLPEAKSDISWWDNDHLLVATNFGEGTVTTSGYPKTVRLWTRGEALNKAKLIYEGKETDVYISAYREYGSGGKFGVVSRSITFYESEMFLFNNKSPEKLVKIPVPKDADYKGIFENKALYILNSDLSSNKKNFKSGSLISVNLSDVLNSKSHPTIEEIFVPTKSQSLDRLAIAQNALILSVLDDVKSELYIASIKNSFWVIQKQPSLGVGSIQLIDSRKDMDVVQFQFQNFLRPTELYFLNTKNIQVKLTKKLPNKFDNKKFEIVQYFATSEDGTRVPYFVVAKKNLAKDSKNKTLLYGYGGFQISTLPHYSAASGKLWLEEGGVHVYANIRGGGEYGPSWHQAALKGNRQKAFDDFIAIAEDLISKKITSPPHLGIMGGSNGGLLVSTVMLQRPDLFKAVICAVPLTDMFRYHKLLAGASWMAEYGNPDDKMIKNEIAKYSPYQNVEANKKYPHVFFVTSTKDDRVHPGHARKMAARMKEFGHEFYYFENRDGGHGVSANLIELAKRTALQYTYLKQQL